MKVLIATVKPFAKKAVEGLKSVFEKSGYDVVFLEKYASNDELKNAVKDVDALIVRSDKITKEILDSANNLKIVVRAGAGYDNIDLKTATEKGIVVMNTPGQNSNAVAELVFGMMLYMARNKFSPKAGKELRKKSIGIHAYGNVGRYVAKIAKGFGMEVFAFDPFVDSEKIKADGVIPVSSVEELYSKSDYVSLHIPKTEKTIKSINYSLLSNMKDGATLINTARKEVIDEDGLLKIMEEKSNFSYISDIAPDSREIFEEKFTDRVFFTPKKMGAQTEEANINAAVAAATQIVNFFEKNDTTFQVNR